MAPTDHLAGRHSRLASSKDWSSQPHEAKQKMAWIIRGMYGKSVIGYSAEDANVLEAYFENNFVQPGSLKRVCWNCGGPIPSEVMPRRVRLAKAKTMSDWMLMRRGGDLVSSRVKDAVEELDPGRHQFFPVIVEDKDGSVRAEQQHFILNVVGRIDSIIAQRSHFDVVGQANTDNWAYSKRVGPWHCTLDVSVIDGRACWVEHRYTDCWFVSDRLAAMLRKRKVNGIRLDFHSEEASL